MDRGGAFGGRWTGNKPGPRRKGRWNAGDDDEDEQDEDIDMMRGGGGGGGDSDSDAGDSDASDDQAGDDDDDGFGGRRGKGKAGKGRRGRDEEEDEDDKMLGVFAQAGGTMSDEEVEQDAPRKPRGQPSAAARRQADSEWDFGAATSRRGLGASSKAPNAPPPAPAAPGLGAHRSGGAGLGFASAGLGYGSRAGLGSGAPGLVTKGVSFVSSGKETLAEEDDSEHDAPPEAGVASGDEDDAGNGNNDDANNDARPGLGSRSNDEFAKMFQSFRAKQQTDEGEKPQDEATAPADAAESAPSQPARPAGPRQLPREFAKFEAHGTGFASKYLAKFGFQGALGKNEQGMSVPVAVKVRPDKVGLGFGGFKEAAQLPQNKKISQEIFGAKEAETSSEDEAVGQGWKDGAKAGRGKKQKKQKQVYMTAAEVIAKQSAGTGQVIVDMRGPQVRVSSNFAELARRQKVTATGIEGDEEEVETAAPVHKGPPPVRVGRELKHNVGVLATMAEVELHAAASKLADANRKLKRMQEDCDKSEADAERCKADSMVLEGAVAPLMRLVERVRVSPLDVSFAQAADVMRLLHKEHPLVYLRQRLYLFGPALLQAMLPPRMSSWDPLDVSTTKSLVQQLTRWSHMIKDQSSSVDDSADSVAELDHPLSINAQAAAFNAVVVSVICPPVRMALLQRWNPKDSDSTVASMRLLSAIIPGKNFVSLLQECVVPKLTRAVQEWLPATDPIPIHHWLHPWIDLLQDDMTALMPVISFKLSGVLTRWTAADPSAKSVLAPWHHVFAQRAWDSIMVQGIMPKLVVALKELTINPAVCGAVVTSTCVTQRAPWQQQDIQPIQWIMDWGELMPQKHFVALLEGEFFPKWLHTLLRWLRGSPDFDEVAAWYTGWKSLFSPYVLSIHRVQLWFIRALMCMQVAVEAQETLKDLEEEVTHLPASYSTALAALDAETAAATAASAATKARRVAPASQSGMSFRDTVAHLAEQAGVGFFPHPSGAQHGGNQIYRFGEINVFIFNGVVYAQSAGAGGGDYEPVSLDELLARANRAAT